MVDLIILILLIIIGFLGAKKGLIAAVVKILGFVVAIFVATNYSEPIENYLRNNYEFIENIESKINIGVQNIISSNNDSGQELSESLDKEADSNENIKQVLDKVGLTDEKVYSNISSSAGKFIASKIIDIIVYVGVFMAIILLFEILGVILSFIFKLPGLNFINRLGGFVVEILQFILILSIILYIVSIFSAFEFRAQINEIISNSIILSFLYNNNIVYLVPKTLHF